MRRRCLIVVMLLAASPFTGVGVVKAIERPANLERLTERYDGLRVSLSQATAATAAAQQTARTEGQALSAARKRIGRLAAADYMSGGVDTQAALAAADDPSAFLERADTVRYFTQHDDAQVRDLVQAIQGAEFAAGTAQDRAAEVGRLRNEVRAEKRRVAALYASTGGTVATPKIESAPASGVPGGSATAAAAVRAALSRLGMPYLWGGSGPDVFDCSGLTMWAYQQAGVELPHFTTSQYAAGTAVPENALRPGDLVFFYSDMHHVGMYIGGGNVVHAPHTGDVVRITPLAAMPYDGAVRID